MLIVEDDPDIREAIRLALDGEGYAVVAAEHGRDALDKLAEMPRPCLILLDLMMPVMDGMEFLAAMREDVMVETVPVVIVSAYDKLAEEQLAAGFLRKPVDLDVLLDTVKRFCGVPARPGGG